MAIIIEAIISFFKFETKFLHFWLGGKTVSKDYYPKGNKHIFKNIILIE